MKKSLFRTKLIFLANKLNKFKIHKSVNKRTKFILNFFVSKADLLESKGSLQMILLQDTWLVQNFLNLFFFVK